MQPLQIKKLWILWGNIRKDGSTYIFPVLTKGITAVRERQLIQQLTGVINDHMKTITGVLGIETDCTTYAARHSFATLQLTLGTDIYTVSKMLGHKNLKTTQVYAKVIDQKKQEAANKIKLEL